MTSGLDKKKGLDFKNALDHLSEKDEILKKVIKQIKPKEPDRREPNFEALVRIISGQQLSSAAASTIFSRLKYLFENKEITPSQIKNIKSEKILAFVHTALKFLTRVGVIQFDEIVAILLSLNPNIIVAKFS